MALFTGKCFDIISLFFDNYMVVSVFQSGKNFLKTFLLTFCEESTLVCKATAHGWVMFSDIRTLKKSEMLSNRPKWLIVTQSVLFGSQDLEIRSHVSSFSVIL